MVRGLPVSYPTKSKHICVITPCWYAYKGYEFLLKNSDIETSRVMVGHNEVAMKEIDFFNSKAEITLSVFLIGDLCAVLSTLRKCVTFINTVKKTKAVILYCRLSASWLYHMMQNLLNDGKILEHIQIVSLSVRCEDIFSSPHPFLKQAARLEEKITGEKLDGFTTRELDVMLYLYRGIPVKEQSVILGISIKTIYTHRQNGGRKLYRLRSLMNKHDDITLP